MRHFVDKVIKIIIFILHFQSMQSFGSPTNSFDTRTYTDHDSSDKITIETSTKSWDVLMNELYGIPLKSESTYVTTSMPSRPAAIKVTTNERPLNISDVFYFRENVANYPDLSKYEHLLKKFENYFDTNELDTKTLLPEEERNYIHLCEHEPYRIQAQEVLNKRNEKVLIVNQGKYTQIIEGEACGQVEDTPCGNYLKNYHEGYKPMCKQNYILRKMVVLKEISDNSGEHEMVTDDIPIPGCCECVLKKPLF